MNLDRQTMACYQDNAADVCAVYRNARGGVAAHFAHAFCPADRVLDIGCGSGRDMAALQAAGVGVSGVDPSAAMLDEATRHYAGLAGHLQAGALPRLDMFAEHSFDGILCAAVLMHLPEELLFDSAWEIKRLLKENGSLLVSLPLDKSIQDQRDDRGRLFNGLLPDRLQLLLERIGFQEVRRWTDDDGLGRPSRTWVVQHFRLQGNDGTRSIDRIESVLNRDNKVATYKLALFRSLAELAQTNYNLAVWRVDGKVLIPIEAIAEKWIQYYWPIVEYSEVRIPQTTGRPIAFRSLLEELIGEYRQVKGGLSRFSIEYRNHRLPTQAGKVHARLMRKIKTTIWNQPVRYAGGGADFSVFGYDKAGKNIILDADMWRELSLTGSWIQDATILRWAELTSRISNETVRPSQVIDLLLTDALPERDVRAARDIYDGLADKHCVWSDKRIAAGYDVDHAIPFSLWHNNDLWNLFPACSTINTQKKDKLPTRALVHHRKDAIVHCWDTLQRAYPTRFAYEMGQFCGTGTEPVGNWENRLFRCFSEAIEITAHQRGAARWQPPQMPVMVDPGRAEVVVPPPAPPVALLEELPRLPFSKVAGEAFKSFLPFAGEVAAGISPHDLDLAYHIAGSGGTDALDDPEGTKLEWMECPRRLVAKRRFVVRITGDSMEPICGIGDYVLCEYHRHVQPGHSVVIMANFSALPDVGQCAVKRIRETSDAWVFGSDNPAYEDITVLKRESSLEYPIYGTVLYNLTRGGWIR